MRRVFHYCVLFVLLLLILWLAQSIRLNFFYAFSHSILNCLMAIKFIPTNRLLFILRLHVRLREQVQSLFPILRLDLAQDVFTVLPRLLFSQPLLVFEELARRVKLVAHVLILIKLLLAILVALPELLGWHLESFLASCVIMDSYGGFLL